MCFTCEKGGVVIGCWLCHSLLSASTVCITAETFCASVCVDSKSVTRSTL
uniref:Uncharacterized protein n=1 Tax=uncultured marine virus TaxID=186617 RepID=A0A0F7LC37_9VIRU|nr:hypothetical protein [uncultured marine virus]